MEIATLPPARPLTAQKDEATWQAAQQLHHTLFTELFRHSGLMDAINVDDGPLNHYAEKLIETLADRVVEADQGLTQRLYNQMIDL